MRLEITIASDLCSGNNYTNELDKVVIYLFKYNSCSVIKMTAVKGKITLVILDMSNSHLNSSMMQ
jgi:hypothetical protein